MQRITPHLWFDTQAKEAAQLYTSIFPNSRVKSTNTLHNTPSGSVDLVAIELAGQEFRMISAGPMFKFTPAISFLVHCETPEEAETLWNKLSQGGTAMMEFGEYPFAKKYGWTADRYGLSWQIMFSGIGGAKQKITPTLMFVGQQCGRAEEAIQFYSSVFKNANLDHILRWGKDEQPNPEGTIKHAGFELESQSFAAMDSAYPHGFDFNEAISFMVNCESQQEIDYFWEKLSADPKSEACGWLKDKFGVSWQVVPAVMQDMLSDPDPQRLARVTQTFLKMKKFDLAKLEEAYQGSSSAA